MLDFNAQYWVGFSGLRDLLHRPIYPRHRRRNSLFKSRTRGQVLVQGEGNLYSAHGPAVRRVLQKMDAPVLDTVFHQWHTAEEMRRGNALAIDGKRFWGSAQGQRQ